MATAPDPFVGTWDLDPSTLDYQHGRPGRRAVYVIAARPDGGLTFDLDADDPDGNPMRIGYGGSLDGADQPLADKPAVDALTLTRLGPTLVESAAKKDGRIVDRWTRELQADGATMVIIQHGVRPDGSAFRNRSVYRRRP
jgi:hypothetical protein